MEEVGTLAWGQPALKQVESVGLIADESGQYKHVEAVEQTGYGTMEESGKEEGERREGERREGERREGERREGGRREGGRREGEN